MRFGSIIVAGLAAVASAMPAKEVASNIDTVTTKSRELQTPAMSLTIIDGPLLAVGQGNFPPIISGFRDIVYTVATYIDEMSKSTEKYSGDGADLIFNSFREFVMVHQELLNILIGKAGLFTTVPFIGQPMAAILRALEGGIDTFAYGLIDMMQTHANDLRSSNEALISTLDACIDSYNGL